jgi:hypothetical protein
MVRAFNLRDGVAIAQIVLFTPAFLFAYSFYRTSRIGWFTVGVFALLRLIGASTRLASISRSSDSLSTTTYICESLGIILLIFLYQEFMERVLVVRSCLLKNSWLTRSCMQKQSPPYCAPLLLQSHLGGHAYRLGAGHRQLGDHVVAL